MLHAVLMTRSDAMTYHGGSGLTIHWLLRLCHRSEAPGFGMSAVFGDGTVVSYAELTSRITQASEKVPGPRRFQRLVQKCLPEGLRLFLEYGFAVLRFLYNLRAALQGKQKLRVVLHAHDLTSGYFAFLRYRRKYPRVFTIHSRGGWVREWIIEHPELDGTIFERILRNMEKRALRETDIVVFTSRASQALFESEHPRLLQGKDVRIVYSGADLDELDSVAIDEGVLTKYGAAEGSSVILCVAALVEDKGPDSLIDALALLPPKVRARASCLLVGRGYFEPELRSQVARNGLEGQVKFLGFLPRLDLLQLMKSATLFVLPSRVSVFDAVLLEAGALGLPIITTAVGGNLEMFNEESALLVPPRDPEALAAAMVRLLEDESLREQLGQNARDRIRTRFSHEHLLRSYESIYEGAWAAWQRARSTGDGR
jgi:glycosyltransferase involved in cell wall biosynthesis